MAYLIALVVCAAVVGYLIFRGKHKKEPLDTYVCDVCGKKECLCHKIEKE